MPRVESEVDGRKEHVKAEKEAANIGVWFKWAQRREGRRENDPEGWNDDMRPKIRLMIGKTEGQEWVTVTARLRTRLGVRMRMRMRASGELGETGTEWELEMETDRSTEGTG